MTEPDAARAAYSGQRRVATAVLERHRDRRHREVCCGPGPKGAKHIACGIPQGRRVYSRPQLKKLIARRTPTTRAVRPRCSVCASLVGVGWPGPGPHSSTLDEREHAAIKDQAQPGKAKGNAKPKRRTKEEAGSTREAKKPKKAKGKAKP